MTANLSTNLEISVHCKSLRNRDVGSKSDPMCILYEKDPISGKFTEKDRSDRIENTLDPVFTHKFKIKYFFETQQILKFALYDCDSASADPGKHDKLGKLKISLAEVVQGRAKNGRPLEKGGDGKIFIKATEAVDSREAYVMSFVAHKLDNKDFFGKSDPFLVFSKQTEDGTFTPVGKTNVVMNDLNPKWAAVEINCGTFCDKRGDLPIRIQCFDYDDDGGHDLIGAVDTTPDQLFANPGKTTFPLINEKKRAKKKSYENSGVLMLQSFSVQEECQFIYYIQAGLQLSFIVSVDFTGSNGDPSHPKSLHYRNPQNPVNQYTTSIQAVGDIIQHYDTDKLFPVFGFGGVFGGPSGGGGTHFNFPLNYNLENPNVCGVQGILDAYWYTLSQVRLSGPTNFAPTIRAAIQTASNYQSGLHYFVLLIITDGAITDMDKTLAAIVEASRYPLSIIIVGVGDAEFDNMEELDGDGGRLKDYAGNRAVRDIVQFVALREVFKGQFEPSCIARYQVELGRKVLAELPNQVVAYLKSRDIPPSAVYRLYSQQFPPQPTT